MKVRNDQTEGTVKKCPVSSDNNVVTSNEPSKQELDCIKDLGELTGKTNVEIESILKAKGFGDPAIADNGGVIYVKKLNERAVGIRLDPAVLKTRNIRRADDIPHVHKESLSSADIKPDGTYKYSAPTCIYDDKGVCKGKRENGNLVGPKGEQIDAKPKDNIMIETHIPMRYRGIQR